MDKCPNDNALADYIAGSASNKKDIEKHISGCKACLAKISTALKVSALYKDGKIPQAPRLAIERAKEMLSKQTKLPPIKHGKYKNLWLLATIIAFLISFLFPRYFLQCLVAAILLGIKWIMESENMRTLILVLDSWRRHEHNSNEEIAQRLRDRNNSILK